MSPSAVEYGDNIFSSTYLSDFNLYVPVGTIDEYRVTLPWSNINNIFELEYGDVDVDGSVSSADVTALYNYLLNADETFVVTGDVDGDGNITAADITAIYNILLGN